MDFPWDFPWDFHGFSMVFPPSPPGQAPTAQAPPALIRAVSGGPANARQRAQIGYSATLVPWEHRMFLWSFGEFLSFFFFCVCFLDGFVEVFVLFLRIAVFLVEVFFFFCVCVFWFRFLVFF